MARICKVKQTFWKLTVGRIEGALVIFTEKDSTLRWMKIVIASLFSLKMLRSVRKLK